ncbi:DBH-like monooxygenase protein 2 homolog [Parambassis ranga]|uniref:DBH-like monooxygenase protein 2 homolog n=1 Tax=Parambassis ranga TaxID=210632 RepID=A0A6P7HY16_9TELE|nr:DBH-like monooxygenase protein 2 homolog [Parambassis ranga]
MHALLLFLYLLLAWTEGAKAMDPTMPFMVFLDQDHLVCLKWGFDDQYGTITFQLTVNTTGWVGFGLSPNGGMKGADIVIGGLGPSGEYFKDLHATGYSMPVEDEEQSYTLLSVHENEEQTIMTFERSIQACDKNDFHITDHPINVIYAYGTIDEISYHGQRRGVKQLNLLNYMPRTHPNNPRYLSATVESVMVPATKTYYHCKLMAFPQLNTAHHIYQIVPVIDNPDIVHHMLLYSCPVYVTELHEGQCYMGDPGDACFGVVASWGVGGQAFEFPENVGFRIGGEERDTLYRLEIHYSNPQEKTGIKDSSGLRLYYTTDLREHDVGILFTGVLAMEGMQYNIPPNTSQFHTYGVCSTAHFSQLVNPVPDLQVFAVLLHTHLAGRKVRVGHFRDGQQIDFLGLDENYDFEMQHIASLGHIKTIKQGDEIAVECTYNTTNRTEATKLGLATTDEMCLAFLFYYPAINITTCISHPDTEGIASNGPDYDEIPDHSEIDDYETYLKTLPQIQTVIDNNLTTVVSTNGTIREMMEMFTVTCEKSSASSRRCTSWMVNLTGISILQVLASII